MVAVRAGASATATHDNATSVTLSIKAGTGAAGAVLSCTGGLSRVVSSGVATFAGCMIDKASPTSPANPYILVASASGLASADSASLVVAAGPATKLIFTVQPSNGSAAVALPTQPVVAITDAGGNVVTTGVNSTKTVTLALGANTDGGVLTCTGGLSKVAVAGLATFAGCMISKPGVGYTFVASSTSLTSATSTPFNITAGANLTIAISAAVITWGNEISVTVRIDQLGANRTVQVQGSRDGANWTTITNLNTGPSGQASFLYSPVTNLYYRANFAGAADLGALASNTTRTVVRQISILRPTNNGLVRRATRGASDHVRRHRAAVSSGAGTRGGSIRVLSPGRRRSVARSTRNVTSWSTRLARPARTGRGRPRGSGTSDRRHAQRHTTPTASGVRSSGTSSDSRPGPRIACRSESTYRQPR